MVIGEVYLNNGMLGRAKECYSVVYGRRKTRRVAMELVNICIRLKKADEAEKYFADYKKMAPNDYFNYIFQYKIDRLKGKPLRELKIKSNTLISYIGHNGEAIIPTGNDVISKGDTVMVVTMQTGFDDIGDILE